MLVQILNPDNYQFNGYAMPMLVVGVAIAVLGFFVLIRERGSLIGILFLLLCLSVGLYLFATGVNYASRTDDLSLLWIRISQLGTVFIPSTGLVLTVALLGLFHHFRFAIACSFVLSTLFAVANLSTDSYVRGNARFFWGNFVQYGPLGSVFIAFFFSIMAFILHRLWREFRRSTTERRKKRFKGLLISFSIAYAGAIDFLPTLGVPVYPFGYAPIFIFIVVSAYVIIRYRLVDITPELVTKQVLETMQGAVIVVDLEGKIRVINRIAQEMLGYKKSELVDRDLACALPSLVELNSAVPAGGRVLSHEMTWQGRSGSRFDVSVSASPVLDDRDRSFVGTVYVAHDITERKQAENRLTESLSLKRATLESTADGILVVNGEGRVVDYNRKFMELWDIPQELMEQKDDDRLLQHVLGQLRDPEAFVQKVKELYARPDTEGFDEVQFKDGRIFERNSIPFRLESKSVGRVWSFRDVSTRKQAEEQLKNYSVELQDSNAELKSFIYSAAHDLRQPLVNIEGFTCEILHSLRDLQAIVNRNAECFPDADREHLTAIFEIDIQAASGFVGASVERMSSLISALLKLSQIGCRKLRREPISMSGLVQSSLRGLTRQIREKNITVIVGHLPDMTADRTALEQIMGNLLDNAVKYLDNGRSGRIEISGERSSTGVLYRVRDNGRGISRDDLPQLFNIFRRLGQLNVPGDGAGLAFVRALVRLHGGRIWCESEEGVGSTFSFVIPPDHHPPRLLEEKG